MAVRARLSVAAQLQQAKQAELWTRQSALHLPVAYALAEVQYSAERREGLGAWLAPPTQSLCLLYLAARLLSLANRTHGCAVVSWFAYCSRRTVG